MQTLKKKKRQEWCESKPALRRPLEAVRVGSWGESDINLKKHEMLSYYLYCNVAHSPITASKVLKYIEIQENRDITWRAIEHLKNNYM